MKCHVYIMANRNNTVLYTGVTSDLRERVNQHKSKKHSNSFSAKYGIYKLVYYERHGSIRDAIKREKQIKGGSRKKKFDLVKGMNSEWIELSIILDG